MIVSVAISFLFACNQDKIDQLSSEKDSFKEEAAQKDSTITEMLGAFNEIQANLNLIKEREGLLRLSDPENGKQSILADIQTINDLMIRNEQLSKNLNQKLKNSQKNVAEFRDLIQNLNRQIELKNAELSRLNELLQKKDARIGQLYFSVDSLKFTSNKKDEDIKELIDENNVAFYSYGTYKELKEKKVLTKEGGFLGLGKTESVMDNVNLDYFTKIDIRKQTSFLIYADKAELVTKHPEGSYEFRGTNGVDSLVITNIDAFWKTSKMMVIVVD